MLKRERDTGSPVHWDSSRHITDTPSIRDFFHRVRNNSLSTWAPLICGEADILQPESLGGTIASIDEILRKSSDPVDQALSMYLLSRIPIFHTERTIVGKGKEAHVQLVASEDVQKLLGMSEFSVFNSNQRADAAGMFDMLSPEFDEDYYFDKVPNLLQAYVDAVTNDSTMRGDFASFLGQVFDTRWYKARRVVDRLEVGLLLAFQCDLWQKPAKRKLTDFDITKVYAADDKDGWREALENLGKRPDIGVWGDLSHKRRINSFTYYSSSFGRYAFDLDNVTSAFLRRDSSKVQNAYMSLGCGPWLLDASKFSGNIIGVDKNNYGSKMDLVPWRKQISPEKVEYMGPDNPIVRYTQKLFYKGEWFDKENNRSIRFIQAGYENDNGLPTVDKSVGYLAADSSIWNTTKGLGRIRALFNVLSYPHLSSDAQGEIIGAYHLSLRSIEGVYIRRNGSGWEIKGLRSRGRDADTGTIYQVFLRDRMTSEEVDLISNNPNLEHVVILSSSELPNLFDHLP